ncbi:MAG TPA: cytochrome d ubiquinol oxidase subunit II [Candidatus Baltobacteraceae bacterium]|jgi:cytochrome d ubiquinol oxidase subunit II
MSTTAFVLLAVMVTAYVLLDGYDLGTAAITPLIARTSEERAASMESIGPFWNGNEVWLIAAGASLFALFPQAYASSFSGFYLPFMVVLWLLMFRGIALELRSHFVSEMWHGFWDFCFAASSTLLILLFGIALGNIVRGLPLDANGYFLGTFGFLLNPYALGVGALAVAAVAQHGATWVRLRIDGPPAQRSRTLIGMLWWIVLALYVATSAATIAQRWSLPAHGVHAWLAFMPVVSLATLIALRVANARGHAGRAFAASSIFLASLLVVSAGTMYPYILPGYPAQRSGLSITDAAPSAVALATTLAVVIVGLCVVVAYTVLVTRRMMRKITV